MPDRLRRALARAQAFYRVRALLDAAIAGAAAGGLATAIGLPGSWWIAALTFLGVAVVGWRAWSLSRTAATIERQIPRFDNLLVTAEEALRGRRIHPVIADELFAQAAARLDGVNVVSPGRLFARAAVAGAVVAAAAIVITRDISDVGQRLAGGGDHRATQAAGAASVRALVTPPAYSGRRPVVVDNPVQVSVLEGSRVRVEVDGRAQLDVVANASQVLILKAGATDRLLHLQVQPDTPPRVTIEQPGRDLMFGEPRGRVPVTIAAQDDLGLRSIALRYTRITGTGETFTFEEGELPVQVAAGGERTAQRATATIVLDQLKLEDGDTVMYRAFARDDKPGADPAASEPLLIEIGRRGAAAAGGFAVPEDRDRQGLSQQMLIMKTERLQSQRATLAPDAFLEQSRLLAVEQRMVRAEFVFMTGGEVVDEVEEAEHAHELATGRFENEGQVELLNAIREMSRAEARLNEADTVQALAFERAALAALQRAFDRRRYFLRTLPERARIDPSRRLTGDLTEARSSTRPAVPRPVDARAGAIRETMIALAQSVRSGAAVDARVAARVLTLDPESPLLTQGVDAAISHLGVLLRGQLAAPAAAGVPRDPLAGTLAEQLPGRGGPR